MAAWLDILIKVVQILSALVQLWRLKGTKEAQAFITTQKEIVCDEVCQMRKVERDPKT